PRSPTPVVPTHLSLHDALPIYNTSTPSPTVMPNWIMGERRDMIEPTSIRSINCLLSRPSPHIFLGYYVCCANHCSNSSAPPMHCPSTNTCGVVVAPITATNVL